MREFDIDGKKVTDTTYRTPIVEHYTPIKGKTFLDIGAGDGCEARSMAMRGAKSSLAVEGKEAPFQEALAAQNFLKLPNHAVRKLDARRIDAFGLSPADVVLCFGFLYHLKNPYNFLKRVKNVTREWLLIETHIAPNTDDGLLEKHRGALLPGIHRLYLDGHMFQGRYYPHPGPHEKSKGSLDEPWTFWLTAESMLKAVVQAGFSIVDFHYDIDSDAPEPIRRWGTVLGFGHANTKIFVVAQPKSPDVRPVADPVESTSAESLIPPTLPVEPFSVRWLRRTRRLLRLGRLRAWRGDR